MYKTILVHVDESARSAHRTAAGIALALDYEAHLVGAAMTGLQTELLPVSAYGVGLGMAALPIDNLRTDARQALAGFEAAASRAGVLSLEQRCIDDEAGIGISMQARYSDLVIVSQSAPDEFRPRLRSDFPDYVVLNAPRPVLVLPVGGAGPALGKRVTVAWNGSPEAVHAIASALPLLQRAAAVDVVVLEPEARPGTHGEQAGADMALYLARHGVPTEVSVRAGGHDDGQALLDFAREKQADLIVMGAYGHTRFRELLLGGMTRHLLAHSPIPLWMAH
ncbi:universal stress protein [Massilia sp. PAMC28688]|uniref:universal stress protein n=1 Tax=Massilia sp. PAMC28688 TaxID=2861283 RepID=UPI001C635951|nr:universal stress protein [Massilia sp. PAMC28688]QYF92994.1 universal stress protein [Massilia sp. PAMC28688]